MKIVRMEGLEKPKKKFKKKEILTRDEIDALLESQYDDEDGFECEPELTISEPLRDCIVDFMENILKDLSEVAGQVGNKDQDNTIIARCLLRAGSNCFNLISILKKDDE